MIENIEMYVAGFFGLLGLIVVASYIASEIFRGCSEKGPPLPRPQVKPRSAQAQKTDGGPFNPVHGTVVPSTWHHMQCGVCSNLFAVEDAPLRQWHCPWCGVLQEMKRAA